MTRTKFRSTTRSRSWAIVLAGGRGTRLSDLTRTASGEPVPKQFCSLDGGETLLETTCARAARVVDDQHINIVVASGHREHWAGLLRDHDPDNVVAQPEDRGTAIGILLPALRIARRDPNATIVVLPSDHHVRDERALSAVIHDTLADVHRQDHGVALLGITPDEADPELGYIVPRRSRHPRLRRVERFVEKPSADEARALMGDGALWNSFVLMFRVASLLALLGRRHSHVVRALQSVDLFDERAVEQQFRPLPAIDFSRDVATGEEQHLAVVAAPRCGWSDLGTPRRLAQALARGAASQTAGRPTRGGERAINLASRLGQSGYCVAEVAGRDHRRAPYEHPEGAIGDPSCQ